MSNGELLPRGLRWAGPALAAVYGLGVRIHRAAARSRFAPIATICIGNLTVGGTGKTPATIYFARELARRGRRPAILMRGYKAQGGDEAEEVKTALGGLNVPLILGSDRCASANAALKLGCDVVLLDDGFQHWRLSRDLDLVLIDATDPFGGGALLPHGKLREPIAGLSRAGAIVVTRSDRLSSAARSDLESDLKRLAPHSPHVFARHTPVGLRALNSLQNAWSLEKLRGLACVAACGIGNPAAFWNTLQDLGVELLDRRDFADHHAFSADELTRLMEWARAKKAAAILITEKDAVKIEKLPLADDLPIVALRVEFQIDGARVVWEKIDAALTAGDARRRK